MIPEHVVFKTVKTKIGIGTIIGVDEKRENCLIAFSRKNMDQEYLNVMPHNGDMCPHIWISEEDIYDFSSQEEEEEAKPVVTIRKKRGPYKKRKKE